MDQGLAVAVVARRLGVAPATLRTWDHRYGLGPSEHQEGTHRRYTAGDLARLEHMQRLVRAGVSPRDAAAAVLAEGVPLGRAKQMPAQPVRLPDGLGTAATVHGLKAAAAALDIKSAAEIIDRAIDSNGVIWTWDDVLVPVLVDAGKHWNATGRGIEAEHALSEVISVAFSRVTYSASRFFNDRPVLLATAPEEMHALALQATAAALAEIGVGTRYLGARVPIDALALAVRRTGPRAVFIWASIGTSADLSTIATIRPAPRCAHGGPGWTNLPQPGWTHFEALAPTVTQLAAWAAD